MKLVRLEIHRLAHRIASVVRQVKMQGTLHSNEKAKIHLREVGVEHERRKARLVHLKRQDDEVEHQPHVLRYILRQLLGGPCHIGLRQRRAPALEPLLLRGTVNALLDIANRFKILVELPPITHTDAAL